LKKPNPWSEEHSGSFNKNGISVSEKGNLEMTLKQAVEKHRKWMEGYCTLARLMGWLLIVEGIGILGCWTWVLIKNPPRFTAMIAEMPPNALSVYKFKMIFHDPFIPMILPGLLALLVAQLLRYLLDENTRPGWLLRHGEKVMYFTAGVLLVNLIPAFLLQGEYKYMPLMGILFGRITPSLLFVSVKLAILVGLAQALRRVLPMIEEGKSLV
jgi:hypothetical protein